MDERPAGRAGMGPRKAARYVCPRRARGRSDRRLVRRAAAARHGHARGVQRCSERRKRRQRAGAWRMDGAVASLLGAICRHYRHGGARRDAGALFRWRGFAACPALEPPSRPRPDRRDGAGSVRLCQKSSPAPPADPAGLPRSGSTRIRSGGGRGRARPARSGGCAHPAAIGLCRPHLPQCRARSGHDAGQHVLSLRVEIQPDPARLRNALSQQCGHGGTVDGPCRQSAPRHRASAGERPATDPARL